MSIQIRVNVVHAGIDTYEYVLRDLYRGNALHPTQRLWCVAMAPGNYLVVIGHYGLRLVLIGQFGKAIKF